MIKNYIEQANFEAETVDAPVINEFPLCLECKFIEYQANEYGCGVIGKVVNVLCYDRLLCDVLLYGVLF